MADCPNQERNKKECTCTADCEKRGLCCECVAYHRSMGQIPGCFFSKKGEAQWDRSAQCFMADREK